MPAVGEVHRQDFVARLNGREIDRHVRLGAAMRLNVDMLGAKQSFAAIYRQLLGNIDVFATAIPALFRITLGVFVREHRTLRFHHRRAGEVFAGDKFNIFLLAQAFIPVQTIQDGVVQIRVLEGEFASCRFEGEAQSARSLLQRYADQLCSIRPMNVASLERYLLLMNDIPGVQAQGNIVPAAGQGGNPDLLIRVNRHNHDASIGISNRESKTLGTWRTDAEADLYGAFGLDGRQWVRYRHTPGGGFGQLGYGMSWPE